MGLKSFEYGSPNYNRDNPSATLNSLLYSLTIDGNAVINGFDVIVISIEDLKLKVGITPGLCLINSIICELNILHEIEIDLTNFRQSFNQIIVSAYLNLTEFRFDFNYYLYDSKSFTTVSTNDNASNILDKNNFLLRLIDVNIDYTNGKILTLDGMNPIVVVDDSIDKKGIGFGLFGITYSEMYDSETINYLSIKSYLPQFTKPKKYFIVSRNFLIPNYGKIINIAFDNIDSFDRNKIQRQLIYGNLLFGGESIWQTD